MKVIKHPFVVQMYEIIEVPKYLFLIMEFVQGGDLFDAISQANKLSEDVCRVYFGQIVLGL
jgi:5'-AMP-activated protein kinase catalytic alpha subunit